MRLRLWTRLWWVPVVGCLAVAVQAAEEPILQLETGGHTAICKWVGFTPDGTRLVSAGDDKVVRVWDVTDPTQPRLERSLRFQIGPGSEGKIYAAAISPQTGADGRRVLAVGGMFHSSDPLIGSRIRLVDLETGEVLGMLRGHTDVIHSLAFSADGRLLTSGSADATVRVWDVGSAKWKIGKTNDVPSAVLKGHTAATSGLTFAERSPLAPREVGQPLAEREGYRLASASDDQTLRLWERNAKGEWTTSATLKGHTDYVMRVVCSPDGRTLASSSYDRSVRLWDARTGQFQRQFGEISRDAGMNAEIAFTPDGRHLVTAVDRDRGGSRVWRVTDGKEVARFDGHDNTVSSVAVQGSPPARREAARSRTSSPSTTGVNRSNERPTTSVSRLAERDGYLVASTGGDNNDIFLWDAANGREISHIVGTGRSVWAVAFSANGRQIAFGNTNEDDLLIETKPLVRTFNLSTLEPEPQQPNFSATGFARGTLSPTPGCPPPRPLSTALPSAAVIARSPPSNASSRMTKSVATPSSPAVAVLGRSRSARYTVSRCTIPPPARSFVSSSATRVRFRPWPSAPMADYWSLARTIRHFGCGTFRRASCC